MEDPKTQLINKLRSSNYILATVSRNPSVDQLSALLGLTLLLNKQGKHAAAVFSGEVPSALEFLQPEETIEKNTDSLRDFIIALDKTKADKLRYKVEDDVVRIFITPYKTSITEDDFDFSQGDFNVDVVVALGVQQQEDLDEAITAHGRILHDATVASINVSPEGGLGSINWHDPGASSLSELVTEIAQALGPEMIDEQIATALLTGIVSETERFSNDKTNPQTMSMSAVLMAAGANQQLVASKLEEPAAEAAAEPDMSDDSNGETEQPNSDGMIEIDHSNDPAPAEKPEVESDQPADDQSVSEADEASEMELPEPDEDAAAETDIEEPVTDEAAAEEPIAAEVAADELPAEADNLAENMPELPDLEAESGQEPLVNVLPPEEQPATVSVPPLVPAAPDAEEATPPEEPPAAPAEQPPAGPAPMPPAEDDEPGLGLKQVSIDPQDGTLTELEDAAANASQPAAVPPPDTLDNIADQARNDIDRAFNSADAPVPPPTPAESLNAQPLGEELHPVPPTAPEIETQPPAPAAQPQPGEPTFSPFTNEPDAPTPPAPPAADDIQPAAEAQPGAAVTDQNPPPPVPPPMTNLPPQVYQPGGNSQQQQ